jgi:hypothetical protein
MTAHTTTGLRSALEYIQGVYGPNFFPITPQRIVAWSDQLSDLDDAALLVAARAFCATAQRGQPPVPADLRAHAVGRWEHRKAPRVDCHLNPQPQALGYEDLLVLVCPSTGATLRAFNARGDLIDPRTQAHIRSAANVPAALRPPESMLALTARSAQAEALALGDGRRGGPDMAALDFRAALGGVQ